MKAGKRALGSVFQRAQDGRWVVRVTLPDGKRITRYSTDKKAAEQLLAQLLTTPDLAPAAPYTLATWLEAYLKRAEKGRAPATVRDRLYLTAALRGVRPDAVRWPTLTPEQQTGILTAERIGKMRLDKVTPAHLQAWVDAQTGAHRGRLKALQLVRSALDEAVALEHLSRNPATVVKLERQPSHKAGVSWTQVQARQFLAANEDTAQIHLWKLALQTGARIGELLALRVSDYDKQAGTLRIERTVTLGKGAGTRREVGKTKTEAGTRSFPLFPDACATIDAQLERRARLVELAGPTWQEQGWLFPSEVGTMYGYDNARRSWRAALKRAGVPAIRTHDLRVTFISLALRRGVKPEVVSRMVGHSSPLITLRLYRHVFQDELDDTRHLLADLV